MQGAVTLLENRLRATRAKAEQGLDAAVADLRSEFASAQKAETQRLESLVDNCTSVLRESSVMGIAKTRATIASNLAALRDEVQLACLAFLSSTICLSPG